MKKDNVRFASLWSKMNTKIARKLGKVEEKGVEMRPNLNKVLFKKTSVKSLRKYSTRKLAYGH